MTDKSPAAFPGVHHQWCHAKRAALCWDRLGNSSDSIGTLISTCEGTERRETVKKEVVIFIPRIQLGITFDRMGDVRNGQTARGRAPAQFRVFPREAFFLDRLI